MKKELICECSDLPASCPHHRTDGAGLGDLGGRLGCVVGFMGQQNAEPLHDAL